MCLDLLVSCFLLLFYSFLHCDPPHSVGPPDTGRSAWDPGGRSGTWCSSRHAAGEAGRPRWAPEPGGCTCVAGRSRPPAPPHAAWHWTSSGRWQNGESPPTGGFFCPTNHVDDNHDDIFVSDKTQFFSVRQTTLMITMMTFLCQTKHNFFLSDKPRWW